MMALCYAVHCDPCCTVYGSRVIMTLRCCLLCCCRPFFLFVVLPAVCEEGRLVAVAIFLAVHWWAVVPAAGVSLLYAPAARRGRCPPAAVIRLAECCTRQHRPSPSPPVTLGLGWARFLPAPSRRPAEPVHIQWHVCPPRSSAAWQCWCARRPWWLQGRAFCARVRRHRSACARGVWDVLPNTCGERWLRPHR